MSRPRTQADRLAATRAALLKAARTDLCRAGLRGRRHRGDRAPRQGDARRALPSLRGQAGAVRRRGERGGARDRREDRRDDADGRSAEGPHRRHRRLPRCLPRSRGAAHLPDRRARRAGLASLARDRRAARRALAARRCERDAGQRPDDALAVEPTTFLLAGAFNEAALWIAEAKDEKAARRAMDRSLAALIERLFVQSRSPRARARA